MSRPFLARSAALGLALGILAALFVSPTPHWPRAEARSASALDHPSRASTQRAETEAGRSDHRGRAPLAHAPEAWIEVLGSIDGRQLSAATVYVVGEDPDGLLLTNVDGCHVLRPDQLGTREVIVDAPDCVAFRGVLELGPGAHRIELHPGGRVRLELHDGTGHPLEGITATLISPERRGDASPDGAYHGHDAFSSIGSRPTQVSNVRGEICWTDLPPRRGYRVVVEGGVHVELSPRHEDRRLVEEADGVRVGVDPPHGVSGRIDVLAGEWTVVDAAVWAGGAVRGRIAADQAVEAPLVTLYMVRDAGGERVQRVVAFDARAAVRADENGRFAFEDLAPGTWAVRAWCEEPGSVFATCSRAFQLGPGSSLDVGDLYPLEGDWLDVDPRILDATGRPLDPAHVFPGQPDPERAYLMVSTAPASGRATDMVAGCLPVALGERIRLRGLQPGHVRVALQPSPDLVLDPNRVAAVTSGPAASFDVGETRTAEVHLVVELASHHPIELVDEFGASHRPTRMWARDTSTGHVRALQVAPGPGGTGASTSGVSLPPGRYELWCIEAACPDRTLVGSKVVTLGASPTPTRIHAEPGLTVSGVLRDTSGAPVADHLLTWVPDGWAIEGPVTALLQAHSAADGTYCVPGVPTGVRLRGIGSTPDLPPLGPGSDGVPDLVLSN